MSRILYCLAALLLSATTTASATSEIGGYVNVISVDAAKKSIRFRFSDHNALKLSEVVASWDDATKWVDGRRDNNGDDNPTVVDSNLVKTLKKDSKAYVTINDRGSDQKTWWIEDVEVNE
jgi:hypothetical protein